MSAPAATSAEEYSNKDGTPKTKDEPDDDDDHEPRHAHSPTREKLGSDAKALKPPSNPTPHILVQTIGGIWMETR